jgi:serine/threonine protein kinase
MKVIDKAVVSNKKLLEQTFKEREILQSMDHPFVV